MQINEDKEIDKLCDRLKGVLSDFIDYHTTDDNFTVSDFSTLNNIMTQALVKVLGTHFLMFSEWGASKKDVIALENEIHDNYQRLLKTVFKEKKHDQKM